MTCLQPTLPASATVPTLLTLLRPLPTQASHERAHAVAGTLTLLGPDLFDAVIGTVREHAADIEYASWLPDPGGLEVDSWAAHMWTSVR